MNDTNLTAANPLSAPALRPWLLIGLGALSILPVMLASTITVPLATAMTNPKAQIATIAFIGSSLPEEALRFAILWFVGLRIFGIERPRDGLVFGVLVSLGFSGAENLFYAVSIGWATGLLKLAIATPIHLSLGITMGGLLGLAGALPHRRQQFLIAALAAPLLMHGVYDLVLFNALADNAAGALDRLAQPVVIYVLITITAVLTILRTRNLTSPA